MKKIICMLFILLVLILSGCNSLIDEIMEIENRLTDNRYITAECTGNRVEKTTLDMFLETFEDISTNEYSSQFLVWDEGEVSFWITAFKNRLYRSAGRNIIYIEEKCEFTDFVKLYTYLNDSFLIVKSFDNENSRNQAVENWTNNRLLVQKNQGYSLLFVNDGMPYADWNLTDRVQIASDWIYLLRYWEYNNTFYFATIHYTGHIMHNVDKPYFSIQGILNLVFNSI